MDRFNQLYKDYKSYVDFLLYKIYNKEDREDLSQQVWEIIWKNISKIAVGKEKPYVRSVCRNVIGNYIHFNNVSKNMQIKLQNEYNDQSEFIDQTLLNAIRELLNDYEYELFILSTYGFKQNELAEYYNVTQPTICLHLKLIQQKLQQNLYF